MEKAAKCFSFVFHRRNDRHEGVQMMTEMSFSGELFLKGSARKWFEDLSASALLWRRTDREQRDERVSHSLHSKAIDGRLPTNNPNEAFAVPRFLSSSLSVCISFHFCLSICSLHPSRLKLALAIFYYFSIRLSRWIYLPLHRIDSKLNSFFFRPILSALATLWSVFNAVTAFPSKYLMNESSIKVRVCVCGCVY